MPIKNRICSSFFNFVRAFAKGGEYIKTTKQINTLRIPRLFIDEDNMIAALFDNTLLWGISDSYLINIAGVDFGDNLAHLFSPMRNFVLKGDHVEVIHHELFMLELIWFRIEGKI